MSAFRVAGCLAAALCAACGVLQTGSRQPSSEVPVGIVRDAEASSSNCRAECDGKTYSIGCPSNAVPRCQCDVEPYATCL